MTDYTYTRTQSLIDAIKSNNRLSAALLEEESSFSIHVFRYQDEQIVMDDGKRYREDEFMEEFEFGYWVIR